MYSRCSLMSVVLVVACVVLVSASGGWAARCKLKRYLHKARQTDQNGKSCWDDVEIKSCWGYCLSSEIADWEFPYKKSNHPVCVHGERKHALVKLRHCDPGVQYGTEDYHFVEAVSCNCKVCSSEDTSCEWLPTKSSLLSGLIATKEEDSE